MRTMRARTDLHLNAVGLLLFLTSLALPYQQGGDRLMGTTSEVFGVMVPLVVVVPVWMVLSMTILWWKPIGWVPIVKLAADLLMALDAVVSIRFSSTFFGEPAFGALVGCAAVAIYFVGAMLGAVRAFRFARPASTLAT